MNKRQYGDLIIATVILMCLGIAYAWSLFVGAIQEEYPAWSATSLSMVFTVQMIGFCSASLLAGWMIKYVGNRLLYLICGVLYLVGMIGAGHADAPYMIWVFYGAMCGFATGIAYNCVISAVVREFGIRAGTASGIMMMGYGMGGLFLGTVVSSLHNSVGWRNTFYLFSIFYFGLMLLCVLIFGHREEEKTQISQVEMVGIYGNLTFAQAVKTRGMWCYYLWGVHIAMLGLGVIGHIAQTAASVRDTASFAVIATGVLSVSNGVSRIAFGVFYDTRGRKFTMRFIDSCMLLSILCFCISLYIKCVWLFLVAAVLMGMGYGGSVPCNSSYARDCFGDKNFSTNFGFLCSDGLLSAFLGPTIMSIILTITGKYLFSYVVLLLCCVMLWVMEVGITRNIQKRC